MLLTTHMKEVLEGTSDDHLPPFKLKQRLTVHKSTNFAPHHIMFWREIQLPINLISGGGATPGETLSE